MKVVSTPIHSAMELRIGSTPCFVKHGRFFENIFSLLSDAAFSETLRSAPVSRWRSPDHLKDVLRLELPEIGRPDDELIECLKNVIKFSVKPGHPYFVHQLFSGLDPYGLAGQLVTDSLNPSVYTYEVAPVFTLMETEVLTAMCKLVGFADGDGIFSPGGSMANGYAINLARFKLNPAIKKTGISFLPRLVIFASEDAHYSVHKMAAFLGLGEEGVKSVITDVDGRMDPGDLRASIIHAKNEGFQPFMIFATAGTTVLGAIDPLDKIAEIAKEFKLWFHVDAAWGGGLLFSKTHRALLQGIDRADSVVWNPHKLLAVPQQCSCLLVRHSGLLLECHKKNADYLFQKDKFYDTSYDLGDKYLQCGRRADVLKFWLMWKAKGSEGFEQHVNHLMHISQHLTKEIKARNRFILVAEPHFMNVCFWYVPQNMENMRSHPDFHHFLHKVAPKIKEGMLKRGSMMLNYQPLKKWPNFFRFVAQNSSVTVEDANFFLDEIERLGEQI